MDHGAGKIGDCQETGETSCEQVASETDLGQCCLVWMCVCSCKFAPLCCDRCTVTYGTIYARTIYIHIIYIFYFRYNIIYYIYDYMICVCM